MIEPLKGVAASECLLDGEIVPWKSGCVLPFAHIQKRLGRKNLTARTLRENPAVFIAFETVALQATVVAWASSTTS